MGLADICRPETSSLEDLQSEVLELNRRFEGAKAHDVLRYAISERFAGSIAMVSSFGADSAVLLDLVADIAPETPVIMVDTGKLFSETLRYRDSLAEQLGLSNVISQKPDRADLQSDDPAGMLWMSDTDACCHIRKVLPLDNALQGYDAWISGRKKFQSATRANLEFFELEDGRVKINPLADWSAEDILNRAKDRGLPPHPMVAQGYPSIGCLPCTSKVEAGEDPRAGRWRGQDKTECGIHLASHGREIDGSGI